MNAAPETKAADAPARTPAINPKRERHSNHSRAGFKREKFADFEEGTLTLIREKLPQYLKSIGVDLKEKGGRMVGKCPNPSHEDKHPSFAILPGGKTCGCFACDFLGDVFALSQWLGRGANFPKAVREVAGVVGVSLPNSPAGTVTKPAAIKSKETKPPAPPFILSDADRETVHAARLAFSNAFHAGEPIIDRIAESLGLDMETLRFASWGRSGLGLAAGSYGKPVWLCYAYPQGLKWRNPDPEAKAKGKARFEWIAGKATAPWRWEWVNPGTHTVYLTEGESDCMALIAAGLETDGTAACVASPGTSFPHEWAPLFRGKRVVLCFDMDKSGRAATATVAAILKGHASEILTWKGTASNE